MHKAIYRVLNSGYFFVLKVYRNIYHLKKEIKKTPNNGRF